MRKLTAVISSLRERRLAVEKTWNGFVAGRMVPPSESIHAEIAASWRRSSHYCNPTQERAPLDDQDTAWRSWRESPLRQATECVLGLLTRSVQEGALLAGVADPQGRLLWTHASNHMRRRAETIHFTPGGRWDERSAGTNAVGLALELRRPVTVFSAEHYAPYVHDWVCYAAPIVHPQTHEIAGILDISSTWNLHTPLGQAAASDLARSIAQHLPVTPARAELELYALGRSKALLRGMPVHLTLRQMEILCLLALNTHGWTLDALHAALYGDHPVSLGTLKAELSHLRRLLNGQLSSRPYRLQTSVWADFIELWTLLRQKKHQDARRLYQGPFLSRSNAPELEEWRHCIDAAMGRTLDACAQPDALVEHLSESTAGSELARARLLDWAESARPQLHAGRL